MTTSIGYHLGSEDAQFLLHRWGRTSAFRGLLALTFLHLQIILSVVCSAWAWAGQPVWGAAALLLAAVVIGRALRGLENLVHEATHGSLAGRQSRLNDFLGDWICGAATLHRLAAYRAAHRRHHLFFGGDNDPDWQHFRACGVDRLPGDLAAARWRQAAATAWAYSRSHFARLGAPGVAARWVAWQLAVFVPAALLCPGERRQAIPFVLALWLAAMVAWPLVRLTAEASEHDYAPPQDVFRSTYTNVGWRAFFFPLGDGFHLLHHLLPQVPFFRLAAAHHALCRRDPMTFAARHLRRETLSLAQLRGRR